jgi:hypothetical protein
VSRLPPRFYAPLQYDYAAEVDITDLGREPGKPAGIGDVTGLVLAIESATDTGLLCYLTRRGHRIAAIVPVWDDAP